MQLLTPEEQRSWVAFTGMLTKLPAALDSQLMRDSGLTFFEYTVLSSLADEPNLTLRMSTLAQRTSGSLSRLSHVVRRLEAQGLVERHGAPEDRRATNATLTGEGLRRVEAARPAHLEYTRSVVLDLAAEDELLAVGRLGERVLGHLSEESASPSAAH